MILQNYEAWRHCIEVKCGIPLTPAYVEVRIQELQDANNKHTKEFVSLYGEAYTKKILDWFSLAYVEFNIKV